jgi:type III pantothenate kinase
MIHYSVLFDIGNTNIKIGFADGSGIRASYTLPTERRDTGDGLGVALEGLRRHTGVEIEALEACLASSVAPAMTPLVRDAVARFWGRKLLLAPEDLPIPLENRYATPTEVGADRLVGAYAARRLIPDAPSIISVDYGTATTFDCVSGTAYLGGLICPGLLSSLEALALRTAKLPHIALAVDGSEPVVGRSTTVSINHGFVFGFAEMTAGLCKRLAETMEGPVRVIATGGFAKSLAAVVSCFDSVRPDLLLEGLRLLYYERRR